MGQTVLLSHDCRIHRQCVGSSTGTTNPALPFRQMRGRADEIRPGPGTVVVLFKRALADTVESDVARYIQIFKGDSCRLVQPIPFPGWAFRYAPVRRHRKNLLQADERQELAWPLYPRPGFSGQSKYLPTLQSYLGNPTYKRFAVAAIDDQPRYALWNPIISNRATFDPRYGDEVNRVRNMLMSNELALKEIGAKRVYFANKDDVLLDLLAANVKSSYTDGNCKTVIPSPDGKALGSARQAR